MEALSWQAVFVVEANVQEGRASLLGEKYEIATQPWTPHYFASAHSIVVVASESAVTLLSRVSFKVSFRERWLTLVASRASSL